MAGGRLLGKLVVPVNTAQPSSPVAGQIYFDLDAGDLQLYVYNGTGWDTMATVNTAQTITGAKTFNSPILSGQTAGANQATPAYSFSADPNTGMYSSAADALDWSAGGARLMTLNAFGLVNRTQFLSSDPGGTSLNTSVNITARDAGGVAVAGNITQNFSGLLTIQPPSSGGTLALYAGGSSRLTIDTVEIKGTLPLTTATSAGAPSTTPSNGALTVDTTNNILYYRSGGTWRAIAATNTVNGVASASIQFTDGDTLRRVTITDGNVTSSSRIVGGIRRPDTNDDSADRGYIYTANVVKVANGSFDVLISADAWGYEDPVELPPNETISFQYTVDGAANASRPAFVTALPASPIDGQEIHYQADPTNGVVWHFRYNASSLSAYKWEFVGGPTMSAQADTAEVAGATSNGAYGDGVSVGPSVVVPLAGDFEYGFGSSFYGDTGTPTFKVCPQWGPTGGGTTIAPNDVDAAILGAVGSGTWNWVTLTRTIQKQSRPAETVTLKMYRFGIANPAFRGRFLTVRPIRVG